MEPARRAEARREFKLARRWVGEVRWGTARSSWARGRGAPPEMGQCLPRSRCAPRDGLAFRANREVERYEPRTGSGGQALRESKLERFT